MEHIVEMLNITKRFPGILANDDISIEIRKGEIHALLGENGAGKTTLMSILFGLYRPDNGLIKVRGEEVHIHNPTDANRLGIGMVHQHFKLVDNFTVAENIILGAEETKCGFLRYQEPIVKILELSERYQLKVDPNALISNISVGMQQRVEILKMLYRNAEILIFDEPTAVLTPQEIIELMSIMKGLVAEGKSIVIITHKLNEIKIVADRCSILRKGALIATVDVAATPVEKMAEMMVGRQVNLVIEKRDAHPGAEVLRLEGVTIHQARLRKDVLHQVGFTIHEGEIVCIAGIEGNGQTQLVEAITGLSKITTGQIFLNGQNISDATIRERNVAGISHIPEDRHKHGLILDYNLEENLILQNYFETRFQRRGFLRFDAVRSNAAQLIKRFDIRCGKGPVTETRSMSGGNQQKAIVAREIARECKVLIAVQPTRGLDVGAIEYIHSQLIRERDRGTAILLVSLELEEVFGVSDRILVIYNGELVGEFDPKTVTDTELGLYMAGTRRRAV